MEIVTVFAKVFVVLEDLSLVDEPDVLSFLAFLVENTLLQVFDSVLALADGHLDYLAV